MEARSAICQAADDVEVREAISRAVYDVEVRSAISRAAYQRRRGTYLRFFNGTRRRNALTQTNGEITYFSPRSRKLS